MADEMMNGAKDAFKCFFVNTSIGIEAYKESVDMATENASGIMYNSDIHSIVRVLHQK